MSIFFSTPRRSARASKLSQHLCLMLVCVSLVSCRQIGGAPQESVTLPPGFILEDVASFAAPVDLTFAPDGRMFVVEQGGRVWTVTDGEKADEPFIDISDHVNTGGGRGLLSAALHPSFPNPAYVYLAYTYDPPETADHRGYAGPDGAGQRAGRLTRVSADPSTGYTQALAGSETVLVGKNSDWDYLGSPDVFTEEGHSERWTCRDTANQQVPDCLPADNNIHTIGQVRFGTDGMLYFSNGDGANVKTVDERALRSLDLDSLAGKLLRIDPETGEGLADNPFWDGDPHSNRSKIYSLGLRNPFRFTIHPQTGEPWIGDVGWESWEEINVGRGADFGWPCYEGGSGNNIRQKGYARLEGCQTYYASANATPAHYAYYRGGLEGAIIIGDIYQGDNFPAQYQGSFFIADYINNWIEYLTPTPHGLERHTFSRNIRLTSLNLGPDGYFYLVNLLKGSVQRLRYAP